MLHEIEQCNSKLATIHCIYKRQVFTSTSNATISICTRASRASSIFIMTADLIHLTLLWKCLTNISTCKKILSSYKIHLVLFEKLQKLTFNCAAGMKCMQIKTESLLVFCHKFTCYITCNFSSYGNNTSSSSMDRWKSWVFRAVLYQTLQH